MKQLALQLSLGILFLLMLVFSTSCDKPAASDASTASNTAANGKMEAPVKPSNSSAEASTRTDKVVAYYFHGDRRCRTCLGIQASIEQTIKERFTAETTDGRLVYREVNTDQEAGKSFVQQFQLSFSTLLVALEKDGKTIQWENCDKVWEYGQEPSQLQAYAAERIKAQLDKLDAK